MVVPYGAEDLCEDVRDLDLGQAERLALDGEHEVVHAEGKLVFVDDLLGRAAALDHEVAGEGAVELCDGGEEVEKVAPVRRGQLDGEAGVDEDELGSTLR